MNPTSFVLQSTNIVYTCTCIITVSRMQHLHSSHFGYNQLFLVALLAKPSPNRNLKPNTIIGSSSSHVVILQRMTNSRSSKRRIYCSIPQLWPTNPFSDFWFWNSTGRFEIWEFEFLLFSFVGGFVGVWEKLIVRVYSLCYESECLYFEL